MPGRQVSQANWDFLVNQIATLKAQITAKTTQQTQLVLDQYGNCVAIIGQLNQTVTQGASSNSDGKQQPTGLVGAGVAVLAGTVWVEVTGSGGGGGSSAVASVFGRTGNIIAQPGDYSAQQIAGLTAFVNALIAPGKYQSVRLQPAPSDVAQPGDAFNWIFSTGSATSLFQIPGNVFQAGAQLSYRQYGSGPLLVVAGSGVTLHAPKGNQIAAQYERGYATAYTPTEFFLDGDFTTPASGAVFLAGSSSALSAAATKITAGAQLAPSAAARSGASVSVTTPTGSPVPFGGPATSPLSGSAWRLIFNENWNGIDAATGQSYGSTSYGGGGSLFGNWANPEWGINAGNSNGPTATNNHFVTGGYCYLCTTDSGGKGNGTGADMVAGTGSFSTFTYGYAESYIWLPGDSSNNAANWVAWWISGPNWPANGEVDIMEILGAGGSSTSLHAQENGGGGQHICSTPGNVGNAWHYYAAMWYPCAAGSGSFQVTGTSPAAYSAGGSWNAVQIFLDGTLIGSARWNQSNGTFPPSMNLLLTAGVNDPGGSSAPYFATGPGTGWSPTAGGGVPLGNDGGPGASVRAPMTVKYVRVWQ